MSNVQEEPGFDPNQLEADGMAALECSFKEDRKPLSNAEDLATEGKFLSEQPTFRLRGVIKRAIGERAQVMDTCIEERETLEQMRRMELEPELLKKLNMLDRELSQLILDLSPEKSKEDDRFDYTEMDAEVVRAISDIEVEVRSVIYGSLEYDPDVGVLSDPNDVLRDWISALTDAITEINWLQRC